MFFHVAIGLFVSIKTRPDFATSVDSKISGFAHPHGSKLFADSKIIHSRERIQNVVDPHENSLDKCGRKANPDREKVADSKISGYVWTGPHLQRCARGHNKKYIQNLSPANL